jgi:hypothetical protein
VWKGGPQPHFHWGGGLGWARSGASALFEHFERIEGLPIRPRLAGHAPVLSTKRWRLRRLPPRVQSGCGERERARPDTDAGPQQRVPFATARSFRSAAAEWSRRLHGIAPNGRKIVGDLE